MRKSDHITDGFALKPIMTAKRRRKQIADTKPKIAGVYFFEAHGTQLIKIGRSANVMNRIRGAVRTIGAPNAPISIWGIIECAPSLLPSLEKAMHNAFLGTRVQGEWFEARKDLALHKAIAIAKDVCGDCFSVRGLGDDVSQSREPNWRDPADNASKMRRRACR